VLGYQNGGALFYTCYNPIISLPPSLLGLLSLSQHIILLNHCSNEGDIIEFEVMSVIAVANPSWEDFGGKVSIEVDGWICAFTRNHG
jgi:hypothetical protein